MNPSILLYLFPIFGTSLGFWKLYSKDQKKKIKNASGYKVILLLLCFILSWLFYIKTYRVATLKNIIVVEGTKGSFNETGTVCKDTISNIIIFNKFEKKKWQDDISLPNMIPDLACGGMMMYVKLNNDSSAYHYYCKNKHVLVAPSSDTDSLKHMYEVTYAATSIPSVFLFSSSINHGLVNEYPTGVSFISRHRPADDIEKIFDNSSDNKTSSYVTNNYTNYGVCNSSLVYSRNTPHDNKEDDYWFKLCSAFPDVNNLSVFSLADLSQCNFEFRIKSDMPIYSLSLFLDVPAEFSSLDVVRDQVIDNGFTLHNLEPLNEHGDGFLRVHAKLPTQENLQLIRSLILTSIITALFTMLATNLYYYSRKVIKDVRNKYALKSNWSQKVKIINLWYPLTKRIASLICVLMIVWIVMLYKNAQIRIPQDWTWLVYSLAITAIIIVVVLIVLFSRYKYNCFVKARHQNMTNIEEDKIPLQNQTKRRRNNNRRPKGKNTATGEESSSTKNKSSQQRKQSNTKNV